MNKKLFKKIQVKDKIAKAEVARAHGIIILLSLSLMMTLTLSSTFAVHFDPILSFAAVILLALVTIFSLSVVLTVKRSK